MQFELLSDSLKARSCAAEQRAAMPGRWPGIRSAVASPHLQVQVQVRARLILDNGALRQRPARLGGGLGEARNPRLRGVGGSTGVNQNASRREELKMIIDIF